MKAVDSKANPGLSKLPTDVRNKMGYMKKGGMAIKHEDIKMDKKTVKKAVGMHDKQMHGGKKTDLTTLKKGGKVKKCAEGGIINTLKNMFKSDKAAPKGKAKGVAITKETITATPGAIPSDILDKLQTNKNEKAFKDYEKRRESGEDYKKGGSVKKFARGGGCEVRGKTRGRII